MTRAATILAVVLTTVAWVLLAIAGLFPLFLLGRDDYDAANVTAVIAVYAIAPVILFSAWSLIVRHRLPGMRLLKTIGVIAGVVVLVFAVLIGIGFVIGWLFDNTSLNG